MMLREVGIGWGWEVYIEMFAAGIAAGAYLIAMTLELYGRGRSPIARTAHLMGLPLVLIATALLIYKLERSERFWHMVIQSENIPWPMLKWWSPISIGSWLLMTFSLLLTISFVDALVDRGWFSVSRWRSGHTIHGSVLGKILAVLGIIFAMLVSGYSGALLSVTAVPGWQDTIFIAPFFIGVSVATGAGALLLDEAIRRLAPLDELDSLSQFGTIAVGWQLLLLIVLAISLGGAMSFFLSNIRTIIAFIVAVLFALAAMALLFFKVHPSDQLRLGAGGTLVLVSGFLFRYAVVMGPQYDIE
jgi:formate-dependent nitrite reductase membrane component NrfD